MLLTAIRLLLLSLPGATAGNSVIKCDYSFMNVPFSTVELEVLPDGKIGGFARITHQGQSHFETFTEVNKAEEETVHGWIAMESSENSIELVIFKEAKPQGRSRMTNHHIPFGKEMWGPCTFPSFL